MLRVRVLLHNVNVQAGKGGQLEQQSRATMIDGLVTYPCRKRLKRLGLFSFKIDD